MSNNQKIEILDIIKSDAWVEKKPTKQPWQEEEKGE